MRDEQGFADFASARAGDLRRQAYLLTGSPERAGRVAERALAETGRRWDKLGGPAAAEEHAKRVVVAGALRSRGAAPAVAHTPLGTAAPTDDSGEAVWRALAGLPSRRRAVLVLRYDEGLDDAAVGARLGVPAATAAAEGEAGLAALRSLLRRRGKPEDLLPGALADTPLPESLSPSTPSSRAPSAVAPPLSAATPAAPAAAAATGAAVSGGPAAPAGSGGSAAPLRPAPGPPLPRSGRPCRGPRPSAAGRSSAVGGPAGARRLQRLPARPAGADRSAGATGSARPGASVASTGSAAPARGKPAVAGSAPTGATVAVPGSAASAAAATSGRPAGSGRAVAAAGSGASARSAVPAGSAVSGSAASTGSDVGSAVAAGDRPAAAGGSASSGAAAAAGSDAAEGRRAAMRPPARARWSVRRRWVLGGAAAVAVLAVAAAVLVPVLRDDPTRADGPVPAAAANGRGQLAWPARGPLAGDASLLRSALRTWQDGVPARQRPASAAVLWAGPLAGARTALLQGTDGTGQSWVAEVAEAGGTLALRSTEPLGRTVPLLALPAGDSASGCSPHPTSPLAGLLADAGGAMPPLTVAGDGLTERCPRR